MFDVMGILKRHELNVSFCSKRAWCRMYVRFMPEADYAYITWYVDAGSRQRRGEEDIYQVQVLLLAVFVPLISTAAKGSLVFSVVSEKNFFGSGCVNSLDYVEKDERGAQNLIFRFSDECGKGLSNMTRQNIGKHMIITDDANRITSAMVASRLSTSFTISMKDLPGIRIAISRLPRSIAAAISLTICLPSGQRQNHAQMIIWPSPFCSPACWRASVRSYRGSLQKLPEGLTLADLQLDILKRRVERGGQRIDLTNKEHGCHACLNYREGWFCSSSLAAFCRSSSDQNPPVRSLVKIKVVQAKHSTRWRTKKNKHYFQ